MSYHHLSVFAQKISETCVLQKGQIAVDCTGGGGGHSEILLRAVGPTGKVITFDQDFEAITHLKAKFPEEVSNNNLILIHSRFSFLDPILSQLKLSGNISLVLCDLGVSSHHLDKASRGFSFRNDAPLDMRMDTENNPKDAAWVVNNLPQEELTSIFKNYGEEEKSSFLSKEIVKMREKKLFSSTLELADLIQKRKPQRGSKIHPATKVFQALRIYVNDELGEIEKLLPQAFTNLLPGGRLEIISFHSLEDRIVKNFFKEKAGLLQEQKLPRHLPITNAEEEKLQDRTARIIKPFPILPTDAEISENPRCRSARLRILEKY